MDPRNEDYYAETPSEKERRQLAEQKQVMKEAFKEALEEVGASNDPNQLGRRTHQL
nr:MAG TPA: hypothetical protein [Caudoviricetes sp.]